jgi:hypothetical protein
MRAPLEPVVARRTAMPRQVIRPIVQAAEPMLATIKREPAQRSWLPQIAQEAETLDTSRWQTRAARGFSWHRSGTAIHRRLAH